MSSNSILILVAAFALAPRPIVADDSRRKLNISGDDVISHFAVAGPQWQTTFLFHNPSSRQEKFYIEFRGDDGALVSVPVLDGWHASVLITLPPGHTYKLVSDYRPERELIWGSAFIVHPSSCLDCRYSDSSVHTIFAMYDPQQRKFLSEATVPQERDWDRTVVLVYDQAGFTMGVALVNPDRYSRGLVTASIYGHDGQLLRSDQFTMDPLTHRAFVLSEKYPETLGKYGHVKFSIDSGNLSGIGLRFSPNGTFTSVHLIAP